MAKRNVFLAMGLEPDEAMVRAIRADLADAIARYFAERPRAEAQRRLGLSQAIVSQIMNGRVEHVSVERLMRAMVRAGIPGFAQWPTADEARAGILPVAAASATVASEFDLGALAMTGWDPTFTYSSVCVDA